jgi:CMP-N-acetylneuraminic acid synthetase
MIAVVRHALQQIPGDPGDIIVLLQPTQPFRKPEHITEAIRLLRETQADSVVSVVALPLTHDWVFQFRIEGAGKLVPWIHRDWTHVPACRQDVIQSYIRDGTVYAFLRRTVAQHGNIYGQNVRPLIIDPADSCELDTEEHWQAVERRWAEKHAR